MTHRWGDKSRHERGYGSSWTKLRNRIILRDRGLCQPCLAKGRYTVFAQVDHIAPKAQGGTDDLGNLQCICTACHDAKTKAEAKAGQGSKAKVRFGSDGWPE